jgi:hypothetical protein
MTAMPAPKGNQYAKGNQGGGRKTSYKAEYAQQAHRLCQMGFTDKQLAEFFSVTERTIGRWKLEHEEFVSALNVGKEVADDMVERAVFHGIVGFTKVVEKLVGSGKNARVIEIGEYYPPNPGAGLRWLAARRPEIYGQKTETKNTPNTGEGFLKFLEEITERGNRERLEHKQLLIDRANAVEADVVGT